MSRQPLPLPCRHLLFPWLMAVVLLGGCDSQPPTPPAGTGKPPGSGQVVRPDTRIATAQSATSETRSVSTGQAEEGGKPDEGTLVLPSDPPASDTPVSSSAAPDTGPPRTQAQAQASAPQAIDDATALRVLKSNHCASCHQPERKVVGPAFRDIGRRHAGQPDAGRQLAASILGGSSRNWGPVPMPPQPHVNDRDLKIIVDWILQQH
ncbi:c-type cytochrome [Lautropia mirabilis]|jgi:cytochrome c-552|uniref:c-type cytochrome n=2 Tax=Lautropia mirabilis TaxID=47671 RepID=UPI000F6EAED5|nr:Cytochrome c552 [Lautropia mirabilis]